MPTREQLIDAAERVLRTRGVAGATTRAIAEEAGCAEGSLYTHFADKGELLAAVLLERMPGLVRFATSLPAKVGTGTVTGHLTELARLALAFAREVIPMLAPVLADPEVRRRHAEMLRRSGRGPHRAVEAIATYLAGEQQLGRVRADVDPTAAALVLLGGCYFAATLSLALPPELAPLPTEGAAEAMVAVVLHGLLP